MQAAFDADEKRMLRMESLAKIGAASRQELGEVTALHHSHETEVAAVQGLGDREVVFVPATDDPGTFLLRAVRLGPLTGDA